MAIVSGQFLHDAHGFVIDRIQTGGVSNLNIPEEKIYELGNYRTVATVRDIPDLSFELESLDMSTEIESLLLSRDPTAVSPGDEFDFLDSVPMDVISPFKAAKGLYNIVKGVIVPYLTLENATYRFGNRQNATQSFTLRGDAVYYIPGTPYYEEFSGDGATSAFAFGHTAIPYSESGDTIHALSVCVVKADGTYRRLFYGSEYTDTTTNFTLSDPTDAPVGSKIRVVYGSTTAATYPQTVHQNVSVKPAAVRGKDIDVYIGTPIANEVQTVTLTGATGGTFTLSYSSQTTSALAYNASASAVQTALEGLSNLAPGDVAVSGSPGGPYTITFGGTLTGVDAATIVADASSLTGGGTPSIAVATSTGGGSTFSRWSGVQSFEATRRVNLDKDEEFGNKHYVSQDYDTAEVSGSIVVRSRDVEDLFAKIHQVTNVSTSEVVGAHSAVALPIEIRIHNPDDGTLVKTLYIPDARFTVPGLQGRVQQKLETTFAWSSDGGTLLVYEGARP